MYARTQKRGKNKFQSYVYNEFNFKKKKKKKKQNQNQNQNNVYLAADTGTM